MIRAMAMTIGLVCLAGRLTGACEPVPDALSDLLEPSALILVGEIHGTREAPLRFADIVCEARRKNLPVNVGLELPEATQSDLKAWLSSGGTVDDQERLTANEFWRRDYQDGRSSEAMLELLDTLRQADDSLSVFVFDRQVPARDRAMALVVLEEVRADAVNAVLTGNIHSRTIPGTPWDPVYETMGAVIREQRDAAISIELRMYGGSAWICSETCGPQELGQPPGPAHAPFARGAAGHHHDWQWAIGKVSASPPAVVSRTNRQ